MSKFKTINPYSYLLIAFIFAITFLYGHTAALAQCEVGCTVPVGTTWNKHGFVCSTPSAISMGHGATISATDSSGTVVGTADFVCDNGIATPKFGATCGSKPGSWTEVAGTLVIDTQRQAEMLADGRVLYCGGGTYDNRCDIYNPATNTHTQVANMPGNRNDHGMARLGDGTVMVIGQSTTSYRYNPSTNTFSSVTGSPSWDDPAVATLDNGSVIACRFSCSIYNGSTWTAAASVSTQAMSSATLADGRAMMCLLNNNSPESCSIYNRSTNVHSLVSNRPPLLAGGVPQMARLGDGRILMCNSYGNTSLTNQICYAYHPDIDRYSRVADLPVNIANFMMSELSGGQALLCGGSIYTSTWTQTNRCFRFTP